MPNPFVYLQLHTQDKNAARVFYADLFNWSITGFGGADDEYLEICTDEAVGGGMMACKSPTGPSQWIPYIAVDDIDGYAEKARSLGATILVDPTDLPGKGRFCMMSDPTGAAFAIWKPVAEAI